MSRLWRTDGRTHGRTVESKAVVILSWIRNKENMEKMENMQKMDNISQTTRKIFLSRKIPEDFWKRKASLLLLMFKWIYSTKNSSILRPEKSVWIVEKMWWGLKILCHAKEKDDKFWYHHQCFKRARLSTSKIFDIFIVYKRRSSC